LVAGCIGIVLLSITEEAFMEKKYYILLAVMLVGPICVIILTAINLIVEHGLSW